MTLLEKIRPDIEATIERLKSKKFQPDPLAGESLSRIVSIISSAYKRHGFIIERAILEQLKLCPDLEVWEDRYFQVSPSADHIVDSAINDPSLIQHTNIPYIAGHRTLQVDAIVYDRRTGSLSAYEIKRGSGTHDSGKRRSILRDTLCLQILLKSYGELKNLIPQTIQSRIIFYYGKCSIGKPYSLVKNELDDHFNWNIASEVEKVNEHFREKLISLIET
ncbi:hypothetical protein [Nisaea sp.]|uniref:hypothetical protein n=1 Tax=Nisaea sp. TaxID=2024842 RepID=UPI003B5285D3